MGVSMISINIALEEASSSLSATNFTKYRIKVLGTPPFTPYILIWSPLYVAQPKANSERSPVPITSAPNSLLKSIRICVRSRAWQFSYVVSRLTGSYPMSRKCWLTLAVILISRILIPRLFIKFKALSCVRSVVPNPGIVTPIIPFRSIFNLSNVFTQTSRASVLSSPPLTPITTVLLFVCTNRLASPATWILNISSQSSAISADDGMKGCGAMLRSSTKLCG